MPSKCNIEKIKKEIDKCEHPNELVANYAQIKAYIADKLNDFKIVADDASKEIQISIEKINGN